MLVLELTERVLTRDSDEVTATLNSLRRLGVAASLDDFGTGYSSMVLLKKLPIAEIKIDRSFVSRLTADPGDVTIVASIVDLAHGLGMTAVAEGVESAAGLGPACRVSAAMRFRAGTSAVRWTPRTRRPGCCATRRSSGRCASCEAGPKGSAAPPEAIRRMAAVHSDSLRDYGPLTPGAPCLRSTVTTSPTWRDCPDCS